MRGWIYFVFCGVMLTMFTLPASSEMCAIDHKGGSSEKNADQIVAKLMKKLNLTPEQVQQVQPIVQEKIDKKKSAREEFKKQVEAIKADYKSKLNQILTPEQQAKLEQSEKKDKGKKRGEKKGDDEDQE